MNLQLKKYKIDCIPVELNSKLKKSLDLCQRTKFNLKDYKGGFLPGLPDSDHVYRVEKKLQENLSFFDLQDTQLSIVKEIFEHIKLDIIDFLESNFKIINIRAFEIDPSCEIFGPNAPHIDGCFLHGTHKLLIYVNGADKDYGTTALLIDKPDVVMGPPGVYLLFNPKTTRHQGIIPEKHKKTVVEVTLFPWEDLIINPVYGGTNAVFPVDL
jgi:hypothetical protein